MIHTLLAAILLPFFIFYARRWLMNHWTGHPVINEKICRKREEIQMKKDKLKEKLALSASDDYLSPERKAILDLSTEDLVQKMRSGGISAVAVLAAYQSQRIQIWHDELPNQDVAVVVKVRKSLGAVPFCLTDVQQTMLFWGCSNPIFGQTTNPHNPARSPGGSSGGEGCLIGCGGSPVGIGSDVGGSARIPAVFCGVASIKPTARRLSYHGFKPSVKGIVGIDTTAGIIGKDVETVISVSRHLLGNRFASELDPLVPFVPFNEMVLDGHRPLKIGYYLEDDFVPATPGMKRVVREAIEMLQEAGHELVPFRHSDTEDLILLAFKIMQADEGSSMKKLLLGERVESIMLLSKVAVYLPHWILAVGGQLMKLASPILAKSFAAARGTGLNKTGELWAALSSRDDYKRHLMDNWRSEGLDLIICPGFACPAPEIGLEGSLTPLVSYTMIYNILNFPAGIVPVSKESTEDQEELKSYPTKDKLLELVAKTTKGAIGLPLAVQVVGLPWHEELVLRGMRELDHGHGLATVREHQKKR